MTSRGEELTEELAREIREAVARAAPPGSHAPASERETKELEEVRTPLRRAEEHVTPTVPDAAPFFGAKSAVVRLLRFLWRGQASFNTLLLEAGNAVLAAIERNTRRFEELLSRAQAESERRDSAQDARLVYLEGLSLRSTPAAAGGRSVEAPPLPESVYALFEERFRGPSSIVAEKQKVYLPFLENLPGPVFDAGCGRGEFLRLLRDHGIAARGVDASGFAVDACRTGGLDVRQGDAIEALAAAPSGSVGAVVAFQVVEHWPAADTFRFLAEARRVTAPGGILIVETVNTGSLAAMNAFYLDPTHVRPVPPEALRFLCDAAGFRELSVEFLSPVPASERLVERTENDARLNAILFGPQDYAVIGRVPRQ
jgi:SAM-dependent methyltransferase